MKNYAVHDDIDALRIPIQERIALATVRQRPTITNGALARILGLGDSGTRSLLRRLKQQGWLREIVLEGRREFTVLVGQETPCQKVTQNETVEMRQKMTGVPPPGLTEEERRQWKILHFGERLLSLHEAAQELNTVQMTGYFSSELARLVEEIKSDADVPEPAKSKLLAFAEVRQNFLAAANFVAREGTDIPAADRRRLLRVIEHASPEQLAGLCECIQSGTLLRGDASKSLLIDVGPTQSTSVEVKPGGAEALAVQAQMAVTPHQR